MGEPRRVVGVIFQPEGRKPMRSPYPQVSFVDRRSLRSQVGAAVRRYWPRAVEVMVELRGSWRDVTGQVTFRSAPGLPYMVVNFVPTVAPSLGREGL